MYFLTPSEYITGYLSYADSMFSVIYTQCSLKLKGSIANIALFHLKNREVNEQSALTSLCLQSS